jgi:hypothetical protein
MARSFNGTSENVNAVSAAPVGLSPTVLTLAAWFKPNLTDNSQRTVFGIGRGVGSSGPLAAIYILAGNNFFVNLQDNSAAGGNLGSAGNLTGNTGWNLGVGTFGALQSTSCPLGCYLNAANFSTVTRTIGANNFSACTTTSIGAAQGYGGTDRFSGNLAHLAIWTCVLTQQEVWSLYIDKLPHQVRPLSLAGYWPLDGYGHPALDRSIYKQNGVLTGTGFATGPPRFSDAPILYPIPDPRAVMPAVATPPPPTHITVSYQRAQQILMTGP